MILQAQGEWSELHPDTPVDEMMLPLIRLRVSDFCASTYCTLLTTYGHQGRLQW